MAEMKKRRRQNSPERVDMLAARYADQRSRTAGFTPAHIYGRRDAKHERDSRMVGMPAAINRWNGQPHLHARQTMRRVKALARADFKFNVF